MRSDDPRIVYKDIIDLPYRKNPNRKQMSLYDRAAQFAPFAALSGYDEMITEEARLTEEESGLSDYDSRIIIYPKSLSPTLSVTSLNPAAPMSV